MIVAHGNVNKAIIESWLDLPEDYFMEFIIQPASITILGVSPFGHPEIRKLNETAHLAQAGLDKSIDRNWFLSNRAIW